MRAASWKGTSELVAPHDISSKFLLRMRGEDRPPALAFLDQQAILRSVRGRIYATTTGAQGVSCDRFTWTGNTDRTRSQAATATTGHRASHQHPSATERIQCDCFHACHGRSGHLHLRRPDQERHPLLAPRSWTSTLLATQRPTRNAPRREAARH